jgi:hypothetical protein
MITIKILGTATELWPVRRWLKSYDPDAHDGHGDVVTTNDRTAAKQFASAVDALEECRRVSTVRPLRPDGMPNRPLSDMTVEIDDEQQETPDVPAHS